MEVIVDEMIRDRENHIDQALSRFMDPRLKPGARESEDGYLPILGAAQNVSIAFTAVTNSGYREFLESNGNDTSLYEGNDDFPAVNVSFEDAVAYCNWLSERDETAVYRLPDESEWEQAAGHMPKDADFNSGIELGISSAYSYPDTLSASGAIGMWGNVWEWTRSDRDGGKAVKGGAWNSDRTDCRTENRNESRNQNRGYDNVGFRVVRES